MAIDFAADLDEMMAEDEFSVAAKIGGVSCFVIYDRPYLSQDAGEMSIQGATPVAYVRDADVGAVAVDDSVTIDGSTFTVRGIEPDGTGVTILVLEDG